MESPRRPAGCGWRGVVMKASAVRQLPEIRHKLFTEGVAHEEVVAEPLTAAA